MDEKPPPYIAAAREHGIPLRQSAPISSHNNAKNAPAPPPPLELPILNYMRTHRVILASASPRRRAILTQVLGGPRHASKLEIIPSTKPEDLDKKNLDPYEYVLGTATQKALDVYAAAVEEVHRIAEGKPDPKKQQQAEEEEGEDDESEEEDDDDNAAAQLSSEKQPLKPNKKQPQSAPPPSNHDPSRDPDLVIAADTVIVTRDGRILEKPKSPGDHIAMLRLLRDTRHHKVLTAVCCIAPRTDAQHPGYEMDSHVEETVVYFCPASKGLPDDVIDSYVKTREGVDKAGGYAVQGLAGMMLVEKIEGSVDNVVGLPVRETLRLAENAVFRQMREEGGSEDEDEDEESD